MRLAPEQRRFYQENGYVAARRAIDSDARI